MVLILDSPGAGNREPVTGKRLIVSASGYRFPATGYLPYSNNRLSLA
jgi:hypothetical protein